MGQGVGEGSRVAAPAWEAEINGSEGGARVYMDHPVSQEPSSISQAWAYLVTRSGAIHNSCMASGTRGASTPGYAEPIMDLRCMARGLVLDSTHEILNASALVPVQRRTTEMDTRHQSIITREASEETNGRGDVWKT